MVEASDTHQRTADMATMNLHTALLAAALAVAAAACGSSTTPSPHCVAAPGRASSEHRVASSATVPADRPTEHVDRLVDVGHGKLHLRCDGDGPVTVLLIAGWDNGAEAWGPF